MIMRAPLLVLMLALATFAHADVVAADKDVDVALVLAVVRQFRGLPEFPL